MNSKSNSTLQTLNQEDATKLLIRWLKDSSGNSSYGYDYYLPRMIRNHIEHEHVDPFMVDNILSEVSPKFYAAAWELCRRGIIRPGISRHGEQSTPDGNAGNGYSITPFGRQWLQDKASNDFIPTEPERFGALLEPYKNKFGSGFHQRAQQAIRCYGAHAYLACCAMAGAATESMILAAAIEKIQDEAQVLQQYFSRSGLKTITNTLTHDLDNNSKEEFLHSNSLLKYWRNAAAHGQVSDISENEAFTSLVLLLRLAQFFDKKWTDITKNTP